MQAGDTFYLPLNFPITAHLWVILSDPDDSGNVLGVNFTSYDPMKDTTLVLDDEHPFIRRKTVVQYSDACLISVSSLENYIRTGLVEQREQCSPELLDRIRRGLLESDYSPKKTQAYLKARLGW